MKPKKPPPQPVRDLFEKPTSLFSDLLLGVDLRDRKRARSRGSNWSLNRQRLAEIARLIQLRHAGPCDTADGPIYLTAALPALIEELGGLAATDLLAKVTAWAWDAAPPMTSQEIKDALDDARDRNAGRRLHLNAREVGDLLELTVAEREALDIRSIRPAGMGDAAFANYQRARDAARKREDRNSNGVIPNAESAAKTRPWIALGIGRRTYYRRLTAGTLPDRGTDLSAIETKSLWVRTDQCHRAEPTVLGPARKTGASRGVGAGGHAPGGKTKAVRRGRAVEMPLPGGEGWTRGDLMSNGGRVGSVTTAMPPCLSQYEGGPMTSEQRLATRDWLRRAGWTHEEFGRLIGLSRQAVTNAIREHGSDGFGQRAASNMRRLALAA